jgi:adenylate cyclase
VKLKRLLALALVVGLSAGVTMLAKAGGELTGITQLRFRTLDWRQASTVESRQPCEGCRPSDVTIVFFDEESVAGWDWEQPFPRGHIASVIDAVAQAGARTIGLDVWLAEQEPGLNAIDGGDDLLRDAMERAGNVILVGPVEQTDSGPRIGPPHPFFADVAAGVGTAELPTAFETVREATLAFRTAGGLQPSFALSLYAHAKGLDLDSLLVEARRSGRLALPGLPAGEGLVPARWWEGGVSESDLLIPFPIRFIGPPSSPNADDPAGAFPAVASSLVEDVALFVPELFQDKIVLVGSGFHDSDKFRTLFFEEKAPPEWSRSGEVQTYGWMYGVEVHANALQDMLDEEYIRPWPVWAEVALILLLAGLTGATVFWKGATWGGVATVGAVGALAVAAFWIWAGRIYGPGVVLATFDTRFVWLPFVTPSLAGLLSYVGSVAYVSVVEGKEKRFIKSAFGKYVSPEVVAEIADRPELLQLGGQKRPLTILFSDLAGFTTLSERMDPQDLLARLNDYLSDMTQIVMDEKGTLDKYIGDAIMAFWNAPKDLPDHGTRGLRAAVLMQRKMNDLNAKWRAADPEHEELVVRIGVNTGTVVVGNVGGADRFDYSAIGDAVNLAARLEPANKSYDTLIMAAQFALDAADAKAFRYRELDLIAVKGKVEPVKVYEILEMAGVALPEAREGALRHYEVGLKAYKSRDWKGAAAAFQAALASDPTDGPSRVYLERSTEWMASPPAPDWDFVVRRTQK